MIYPITVYGDPILKKRALDITPDYPGLGKLIDDMFETMYAANGVGLAAPQVGLSIRLFVVDGAPIEGEDLKHFKKVFINPMMVEETGSEWPYEEGCLSIPGIREDVFRQEKLHIRYWDENWKEYSESYEGIAARIIQHEYDHIEGVLFTDHLSGFKRRLLKGKLLNISKGKADTSYKIKVPVK
jgi:peptide deformylase